MFVSKSRVGGEFGSRMWFSMLMTFFRIWLVVVFLVTGNQTFAAEADTIVGNPIYYTDVFGNRIEIPKTEARKAEMLRIIKRDENYYWGNNKGFLLLRTQKILQHGNRMVPYTIFINPQGEGMITIRNDDFTKLVCDIGYEPNYTEYRLSNYGKLEAFSGNTVPRGVYPPPPKEWCQRPNISN